MHEPRKLKEHKQTPPRKPPQNNIHKNNAKKPLPDGVPKLDHILHVDIGFGFMDPSSRPRAKPRSIDDEHLQVSRTQTNTKRPDSEPTLPKHEAISPRFIRKENVKKDSIETHNRKPNEIHHRSTFDNPADYVRLDDEAISDDGPTYTRTGSGGGGVSSKRKKAPLLDNRSVSYSHITRPHYHYHTRSGGPPAALHKSESTRNIPTAKSTNNASLYTMPNSSRSAPSGEEKYFQSVTNNGDFNPDLEMLKNHLKKINEGEPELPEPIATAVHLFNTKTQSGLQFMRDNGLITDNATLADFLFKYNDRMSKEALGDILCGTPTDKSLIKEFLKFMDFKDMTFDGALRVYLTKFMLPGEAQKIDRMMEAFAAKYKEDNPDSFPSDDAAYVLAFSIIMLNTDRHSPAIPDKDKMTKEQFIKMLNGTWEGKDPPQEYLEQIFDNIVTNEIIMKKKGDPDKKGWIRGIKTDSAYELGRRFLILIGNELRWYKKPTLGAGEVKVIGKIKLDLVSIKEEKPDKFVIQSLLPANMTFSVYDKGREITLECIKIVFTCENELNMQSWVKNVLENVNYEAKSDFDPSKEINPRKLKNKSYRKKK